MPPAKQQFKGCYPVGYLKHRFGTTELEVTLQRVPNKNCNREKYQLMPVIIQLPGC